VFSDPETPRAEPDGDLTIDVVDERERAVRGALLTVSRIPTRGLADHVAVSDLIVRECASDQRGQCRLPNVARARYTISAIADGFRSSSTVVDLSATSAARLVMAAGGFVVSGSVVELTGSPVPEAELLIYGRKPGSFLARTKASAQGKFAVSLDAGPITLSGSASGYSPDHKELVVVSNTSGLLLRLAPASSVTFRVTVREGDAPAADAILVIRRPPPILTTVETVRTDAAGTARARLAPGSYRLDARHAGGSARQDFGVKLGDSNEHVVRLMPGLTLRGQVVVSAQGVNGPVRGAAITLTNQKFEAWRASTDADGKFEVAGLLPDIYHTSATSDQGRADTDVQMADGDQTVVLTVRAAQLEGLVVDSHDAPVAGARVTALRSWQSRPAEREQSGVSQGDGKFSLRVSPGTFVVEAVAGQGKGRSDTVVVPGARAVTVRLEAERLIQGRVEWSSGGAAAGVQVQSTMEGTNAGERTMTDDGGRFKLGPFPSGSRLKVVASTPGMNGITTIQRMTRKRGPDGEWRTVSIDSENARLLLVGRDDTDNVLLRVQRGSEEISGRVLRGDGRPLPGVQVAAIPGGSGAALVGALPDSVTTDRNGAFRIERLPAGEYSIVTETEESQRTIVRGVAAGVRDVTVVVGGARP
jgi:hypothetical protein